MYPINAVFTTLCIFTRLTCGIEADTCSEMKKRHVHVHAFISSFWTTLLISAASKIAQKFSGFLDLHEQIALIFF